MAKVTASTVIKKAKQYIGTKESPRNSNNVIFNTHYYGRAVHGSAYPWCCVFLWDIFRLCGASSLFYGGKKCAYTPTLANWYKSKKQWHSTPKVGDIVFYQPINKSGIEVVARSNGAHRLRIAHGVLSLDSSLSPDFHGVSSLSIYEVVAIE